MKTVELNDFGVAQIKKGQREIYISECKDLSRSFLPGEWVQLAGTKNELYSLGFINLGVAKDRPIIRVIENLNQSLDISLKEDELAENKIIENLILALKRRSYFKTYLDNSRLVFGFSDHLPGLIVDKYNNKIFIQITTAGIDRFRAVVKNFFEKKFVHCQIYLHDPLPARAKECLPVFKEIINEDAIELVENGLKFVVFPEVFQKNGYYYDHRNNRLRLKNLLRDSLSELEFGLDLFSYVGSWGLHMLSAGVKNVLFVDQGNLQNNISANLELNDFKERGEFLRGDVFSILKELRNSERKFQVIVSDPPAFTKKMANINQALHGYEKLHTGILEVIDSGGIVVAASCTQYLSLQQLENTFLQAARKTNKKVLLLDTGLQGIDHPMKSMADKSNYLKYLVFMVEG